jgi:hypothetical protein
LPELSIVFESLIGSLIAAFLFLSFVLLLSHVENLVVLEFLAGVSDRQENGLSGGLQELAFLELDYKTIKIRIKG